MASHWPLLSLLIWIPIIGGAIVLTLSIGVAEARADYHSPEELLAAANRAMYASKHPGG